MLTRASKFTSVLFFQKARRSFFPTTIHKNFSERAKTYPNDLLQEAKKYEKERNYEAAAKTYRELIDIDPKEKKGYDGYVRNLGKISLYRYDNKLIDDILKKYEENCVATTALVSLPPSRV